MKTQVITGEGVCGMQINLNVLDQHEVTKLVKEYDHYIAVKTVHDKWHEGMYDDKLRLSVDPETGEKTENWKRYDWDAYKEIYPEPEDASFDYNESFKTVLVFLRKLVSKSDNRATIFSDKDEE